ncbi:hypothetical protein BD413DRAFT_586215 [Trametes elegans]|nr:hypothetical protein BD413DRAFT_586215 [Trametes elegans]
MLSTRPIALDHESDVLVQPNPNAKTPGRKALKNRAALQENAVHSGAKTVLSKKNVMHTPFRPGTAHGKKQAISMSVTRPLMDKTPFPNRVAPSTGFGGSKTPATKGFKLSKLSLLVPEPEQPELLSPDVAPLLRPSSTRKSLRGRLSGTFKTPVTKGDHWNVSPGDMEMELEGGLADQVQEEVVPAQDEDDEIEYMPPTAIERPYEPPFELPDYKSMGRSLFSLGHAPAVDDTADVYYGTDIAQQVDIQALVAASGSQSTGDGFVLPELEDDSPFSSKPVNALLPTDAAKAASGTRPASTRPAALVRTQAPPRPATAIPHSRSAAKSVSGSSPTLGPAPTRTTVLRAAKAAASNAATTPQPIRPTACAGTRPASAIPVRRTVSTAAAAKAPVRPPTTSTFRKTAASTNATVGQTRPAANGALPGRARSTTVSATSSKTKAANGMASAKPSAYSDSLADMLEKEVGMGMQEDFQFEL